VGLVCLHHPDIKDVMLFLSKTSALQFIKDNSNLWKSEDINTKGFIIEGAFIADEKLQTRLQECFPELLL
jgi:hypothetical protein